MEKKLTKKREKRTRLEDLIPDEELRNEILGKLYKREPLFGDKGIFTGLLQSFVNAALEGEMDNFIQESKTDDSGNRRNEYKAKSLRSTAGHLSIRTPRDRMGDHEPIIVKKREWELTTGLEEIILSLHARGQSIEDVRVLMQEEQKLRLRICQ